MNNTHHNAEDRALENQRQLGQTPDQKEYNENHYESDEQGDYDLTPKQIDSQIHLKIKKVPTSTSAFSFNRTIVNFATSEYIDTCNEGKVITFDSGEHTNRRKYVEALLSYLINVRGTPAIALSALNSQFTKYYLSKLPVFLQSRVNDLSVFHLYTSAVNHVRELVNLMFSDLRYHTTIDNFMFSLKSLESKLIKALNSAGFMVILDRSLVSTYLYNNAISAQIPKSQSLGCVFEFLDINSLDNFAPFASFYVDSSVNTKSSFLKGEYSLEKARNVLYDSYDFMNYAIKQLVPKLKKAVPGMVILEDGKSFQQNMSIIKQNLKEI
jgi:hypothetical protein